MTDETESELGGSAVKRRGSFDPEVGGVRIGHVDAQRSILAEKDESGAMLGARCGMTDGDHILMRKEKFTPLLSAAGDRKPSFFFGF